MNKTTGMVYTLAGNNTSGFQDGVGTNALFNQPAGLAVDTSVGCLYVADMFNNRIRVIWPNGTVATLAGGCMTCQNGMTDGLGTSASLRYPAGLAMLNGSLVVAQANGIRLIVAPPPSPPSPPPSPPSPTPTASPSPTASPTPTALTCPVSGTATSCYRGGTGSTTVLTLVNASFALTSTPGDFTPVVFPTGSPVGVCAQAVVTCAQARLRRDGAHSRARHTRARSAH